MHGVAFSAMNTRVKYYGESHTAFVQYEVRQ